VLGRPSAPVQVLALQSVPGFDGIRVPSRYLMLVACFLAVLVGSASPLLC
jgi:hypothetical protein